MDSFDHLFTHKYASHYIQSLSFFLAQSDFHMLLNRIFDTKVFHVFLENCNSLNSLKSIIEFITERADQELLVSFINSNYKKYIKSLNFIKILEICLKIGIRTSRLEFVAEFLHPSLVSLCEFEEGMNLLRTYAYTEKDPFLQEIAVQKIIANLHFFTSKKEGYLILKHFIYGFSIDQPLRTPYLSKYERLMQNLSRLDKINLTDSCSNLREFINSTRLLPSMAVGYVLKALIDRIKVYTENYSVDLLYFIFIKVGCIFTYSNILSDLICSNIIFKLLQHEKGVAIIRKYLYVCDLGSLISLNQRLKYINSQKYQLRSQSQIELIKTLNEMLDHYMRVNSCYRLPDFSLSLHPSSGLLIESRTLPKN